MYINLCGLETKPIESYDEEGRQYKRKDELETLWRIIRR